MKVQWQDTTTPFWEPLTIPVSCKRSNPGYTSVELGLSDGRRVPDQGLGGQQQVNAADVRHGGEGACYVYLCRGPRSQAE